MAATVAELVHQLACKVDGELQLLHRPDKRDTISYCRTCRAADGSPELWPCPTLRIIRRLFRTVVKRVA